MAKCLRLFRKRCARESKPALKTTLPAGGRKMGAFYYSRSSKRWRSQRVRIESNMEQNQSNSYWRLEECHLSRADFLNAFFLDEEMYLVEMVEDCTHKLNNSFISLNTRDHLCGETSALIRQCGLHWIQRTTCITPSLIKIDKLFLKKDRLAAFHWQRAGVRP